MAQYKGTKRIATPTARKALGAGPRERVSTKDWIASDMGALNANRERKGPKGGKTQAQARVAGTNEYRKAQRAGSKMTREQARTYVDAKKKLPSRKRNG